MSLMELGIIFVGTCGIVGVVSLVFIMRRSIPSSEKQKESLVLWDDDAQYNQIITLYNRLRVINGRGSNHASLMRTLINVGLQVVRHLESGEGVYMPEGKAVYMVAVYKDTLGQLCNLAIPLEDKGDGKKEGETE